MENKSNNKYWVLIFSAVLLGGLLALESLYVMREIFSQYDIVGTADGFFKMLWGLISIFFGLLGRFNHVGIALSGRQDILQLGLVCILSLLFVILLRDLIISVGYDRGVLITKKIKRDFTIGPLFLWTIFVSLLVFLCPWPHPIGPIFMIGAAGLFLLLCLAVTALKVLCQTFKEDNFHLRALIYTTLNVYLLCVSGATIYFAA